MLSESLWILVPVDDVADDGHPGRPGDVGDSPVKLDVHQSQRLLHMLNVFARVLDQSVSMPQVGPELDEFQIRSKARLKQPVGVQLLEPLAIQDVGLSTRNVLYVLGVYKANTYAALLE